MDFGPNWVIEVLPYLEEQPLHDSFDLKIKINDNATNSVNRMRGEPLFRCCSARAIPNSIARCMLKRGVCRRMATTGGLELCGECGPRRYLAPG